jgi:Archaeal putative transposase ISC1217
MEARQARLLDLYTDYLIFGVSKATATDLSKALDGAYSHDQFTRLLGTNCFNQKDLWREVKPIIRQIETAQGLLIVDDTIEEKPYTDESEIVCWHWDHSKQIYVKGINLLNFLYYQPLADKKYVSIPVSYEIISKTETKVDLKTGREKRCSAVTKNELVRQRLKILVQQNQLCFGYVVWDSWFSSDDNIKWVKKELKKDMIGAIKSNRLAALTQEDRLAGRFKPISALEIAPETPVTIYLKEIDFPLLWVKHVFTNDDGATGMLYLVSTDLTLTADQMTTLYHKRWNVEVFHQSLKQNAALEKSPTKRVVSQSNHIFASLLAFVKLEQLKLSTRLNHFALKNRLNLRALIAAMETLRKLKTDALTLNAMIGKMECQSVVAG